MEHQPDDRESPEEIEALEDRARSIVERGNASDGVLLALDQLRADRTNGEPLDVAADLLRRSIAAMSDEAVTRPHRSSR